MTVFEVKEVAEEEAVRIFVKFQKQAAAMKASLKKIEALLEQQKQLLSSGNTSRLQLAMRVTE